MPWITDEEGKLLLRFLEIEPPRNAHGNIKTRYLCFYSSEMKNLKQIADALKIVKSDGWDSLNKDARKRYQNTLINLALLKIGEDSSIQLSCYGENLLEFMAIKGVTSTDLVSRSNDEIPQKFEKLILENLIQIIITNAYGFKKAKEYALNLLFELQHFFSEIDTTSFKKINEDLEKLLFIQIINSSGTEVRRYYNLSESEQSNAFNIWNSLRNSPKFPNEEPANFIEKMAYFYIRPLAKSAIQADIRYRVKHCLNAYAEILEEKSIDIPQISQDYKVINKTDNNKRLEEHLASKELRNPAPIPNQLIITGCPGSGKSRYLRDLIEKDPDAIVTTVTMHPDYTYSDLIGCYKPVPVYEASTIIKKASGEEFTLGSPKINYEFVPGSLVESYITAINNVSYNIVLIIEEINRTNCNSLFGDFFQLLDRDKDGNSIYTIKAMPDLRDFLATKGIDSNLRLPKNLFICGTMNSADQGVFPLDSAFRRRWNFEYQGYKTQCKYSDKEKELTYGGKTIDWDIFRGKINKSLASLNIHEDKLIGPYFLSTEEISNPKKFINKLFLYLWDDVLRFQRRELMDFDSFADLSDAWQEGKGAPLKISLD